MCWAHHITWHYQQQCQTAGHTQYYELVLFWNCVLDYINSKCSFWSLLHLMLEITSSNTGTIQQSAYHSNLKTKNHFEKGGHKSASARLGFTQNIDLSWETWSRSDDGLYSQKLQINAFVKLGFATVHPGWNCAVITVRGGGDEDCWTDAQADNLLL